ncbi:bi-domain-containing oxidoreductase [Candidatus Babeliales bacterium]|nr:bi-domain-containing oxidoreductase [Candidatus Babeliales bacterium]MBP9843431.1 bi-domain-containing oxidoreductase [Candidatus Babeliales bacterium]
MRQVFLNKGAIALKEVCEPALNDHSMLISVYHSLIIPETEESVILQSEQEAILKNIPEKIRMIFNSISTKNMEGVTDLIRKSFYGEIKALGHSCSGKIIAVGKKVTQFRPGDYVACSGNGFANHADIVCIPENFAVKLKDKSLLQQASFITVGGLAFDNIKKAQLQIGQTVCVIGLDLLGQLTAQIAKLSGCKVIGIDTNEFHLKKAAELGIHTTLNPNSDNIEQEISYLTNHAGADCTIITKHIDQLLQQAVNFSKQQGRIVLSQYKKPINLNYEQFYLKEINIVNIPSTMQDELFLAQQQIDTEQSLTNSVQEHCKSLATFINLLEDELISTKPLISHVMSINDIQQAYDAVQNKNVLGLILNFLPKPDILKTSPAGNSFIPAKKDALNVGILGAGSFTQNTLMPILSKIKGISIESAADKNIVKALNIAHVYGARKTIINEEELFNNDNINVVFINTPNRLHCDQAIAAMEKGKAVFLEKPMATDLDQLNTLYNYLQKNKSAQFCVDYNRSFSPFIKKIESYTKTRTSPLIISYRINVGFIAKEQWLQRQMGSGRLIGEACHIFEMFLHLVGAQPIAVSVESLKPTNNFLFPTDNFTAQISFADGSICTLLYTSLGHVGMGKERMEVYFDSKTIIMDDYVSLEGFGLPFAFNENVKQPNTGHEALIHNFLQAIKKDEYVPPISIEQLNKATELTLIIDQLALKGGGEHNFLNK